MYYEIITVVKLIELISNDNFKEQYILVDLRDSDEYQQGHIEYAINIPYDDMMSEFDKMANMNQSLDIDKTIILYCERGGRSIYAAKKLSEKNYTVKSLSGGIVEYERFTSQ